MAEYFSHDYDSREDEKIMDLMGDAGWSGYGLFWGLVELLYKNGGKMRTQYQRIAFALNSHPDTIQNIIENFGLFQVKNGFFSSKSVNKRLKERKSKSEVASANARKRWEKKDANALPQQSNGNAKKESKVKESKVNKIDIPTWNDFLNYATEKKPEVNQSVLKLKFDSWVENRWKDGNQKPIKNWKSKLLNTLPFIEERKQSLEVQKNDQSNFDT
ncbi:DUF4373 domain-containing protein [Candidatus Pacearchaeota archaeon]|nr:DUF4373 domain-containing protein [Candidatus Pacearchaeota archaeon]